MRPVCVKCQRFYKPERTGINLLEQMPEDGAKPGTAEAHRWQPYKLWMGDLFECPGCGSQVVVGCGIKPLAEHFQHPQFDNELALAKASGLVTVNDC